MKKEKVNKELFAFKQRVNDHLCNAKKRGSESGFRQLDFYNYRLSEVGLPAKRIYFNRMDPEGKKEVLATGMVPKENFANNFHAGTAAHWYMQNFGKEDLISIEKEVTFDAIMFELSGHVDAEFPDGILDYKTAAYLKYKMPGYLASKGKPPGASAANRMQANAYAYIMGKKYYAIAYIDKQTYDHFTYVYEVDIKLFEKMIEKISEIVQCLEHETPPMCECENWECGYCEQWYNCIKYDAEHHDENKFFECRFPVIQAKRIPGFNALTKDLDLRGFV